MEGALQRTRPAPHPGEHRAPHRCQRHGHHRRRPIEELAEREPLFALAAMNPLAPYVEPRDVSNAVLFWPRTRRGTSRVCSSRSTPDRRTSRRTNGVKDEGQDRLVAVLGTAVCGGGAGGVPARRTTATRCPSTASCRRNWKQAARDGSWPARNGRHRRALTRRSPTAKTVGLVSCVPGSAGRLRRRGEWWPQNAAVGDLVDGNSAPAPEGRSSRTRPALVLGDHT